MFAVELMSDGLTPPLTPPHLPTSPSSAIPNVTRLNVIKWCSQLDHVLKETSAIRRARFTVRFWTFLLLSGSDRSENKAKKSLPFKAKLGLFMKASSGCLWRRPPVGF